VLGAAPQVVATSYLRYRLSDEPEILYEPMPGIRFGADVSNDLGYRGPLYERARTAGVARIVVVGDSITEGLLIRDWSDVFPAVVERELGQSDRLVEVLGFGVNGYDTAQEVATFERRALDFAPDLVVLQFSHNDLWHDDGSIGSEILMKAMRSPGVEGVWCDRRFLGSALYRFLKYRAVRWALDPKLRRSWEERMVEGEAHVEAAIERLADLGRRHGVTVLVAVFPRFDAGLDSYPYGDVHRWMAAVAERHGIVDVDLLEAFRECAATADGPVWVDHVHPSVAGHRCAGREIARVIRERRLLDAETR
jgi:lysophospholipase L1-like esterase